MCISRNNEMSCNLNIACLYIDTDTHTCMDICHVYSGSHGGQKRALNHLELKW